MFWQNKKSFFNYYLILYSVPHEHTQVHTRGNKHKNPPKCIFLDSRKKLENPEEIRANTNRNQSTISKPQWLKNVLFIIHSTLDLLCCICGNFRDSKIDTHYCKLQFILLLNGSGFQRYQRPRGNAVLCSTLGFLLWLYTLTFLYYMYIIYIGKRTNLIFTRFKDLIQKWSIF